MSKDEQYCYVPTSAEFHLAIHLQQSGVVYTKGLMLGTEKRQRQAAVMFRIEKSECLYICLDSQERMGVLLTEEGWIRKKVSQPRRLLCVTRKKKAFAFCVNWIVLGCRLLLVLGN